jgi:hypothetical protein
MHENLDMKQQHTGGLFGDEHPKILLSELEEQLFTLLLDVVKYSQKDTVVRVAGGWVRDKVNKIRKISTKVKFSVVSLDFLFVKLLQKSNKDIDIVVDNVSGLQFAQTIDKYRVQQGEATAKIGVIQANPEQSKHLETATMNLLGMPIDFVNLRKEAYSDDSRIPAIVSSQCCSEQLDLFTNRPSGPRPRMPNVAISPSTHCFITSTRTKSRISRAGAAWI